MADKLAKKLTDRLKEHEDDRTDTLNSMKEISQFILPNRGTYVSTGQKPDKSQNWYSKIIDPVATQSNNLMGSGVQGGLSSKTKPWFKLEPTNKYVKNIENVQGWLAFVEDRMRFFLGQSNFYSNIHQLYVDEGGFGTSVIFCEPDDKNLLHFTISPPGEYCISANEKGIVDTLFRRYWMRARNIVKKWPNTASNNVKNVMQNSPGKFFEVVHAVYPNKKRNPNYADRFNMPLKSCYFEYGQTENVLSEGGFIQKPFAAGRWSVNGNNSYGDGPGHMALGLVKMLQQMHKSSVKAIHQEVEPAMRVPASLGDVLNMLPGGETRVSSNDPKDAIGRLFDLNFDYTGVEAKIAAIRPIIENLFYKDLFLLITDRPEMTATEVVERSQEKLILIGPTIERNEFDVLDVILEWVFHTMMQFGAIPPPPPELMGQRLKFDYISMLAQAQKMVGLQSMRMYKNEAMEIATVEPGTLLKTNWDAYLQELANRLALSPEITRPDDEVMMLRQIEQQQNQMMQEIAMLKEQAGIAKTVADTDTSQKNLLTDTAGAMAEA